MRKGHTVYEPIPLDELPDDDWRKISRRDRMGHRVGAAGRILQDCGHGGRVHGLPPAGASPSHGNTARARRGNGCPSSAAGCCSTSSEPSSSISACSTPTARNTSRWKTPATGWSWPRLMGQRLPPAATASMAIGEAPCDRADAVERMLIDGRRHVTVVRAGVTRPKWCCPEDFLRACWRQKTTPFAVRQPFVVHSVLQGTLPTTPGYAGRQHHGHQRTEPVHLLHIGRTGPLAQSRPSSSLHPPRATHERTSVLGRRRQLGVSVMPFTAFLPVEHVRYTSGNPSRRACSLAGRRSPATRSSARAWCSPKRGAEPGGFASIGRLFPTAWTDDFLVRRRPSFHHFRLS